MKAYRGIEHEMKLEDGYIQSVLNRERRMTETYIKDQSINI